VGFRRATVAGRVLDEENPINWDSTHARGLVSRWQVIGGTSLYGGPKLRDLCFARNLRNDGTLTNGPTWAGDNGRPGGFGSVVLDGSNDAIVLGSIPAVLPSDSSPITVVAWLKNNFASNSASSANQSVFNIGASAGVSPRFFIRHDSVNTWLVDTGSTTLGQVTGDGLPFAAGEWFFFTFTDTGSSGQLYKNGRAITTTSSTGITKSVGASDLANWGRFETASTRCWAGAMDGMVLYNRALSAAEVAALYAEEYRGCPDLLNWLGPQAYLASPAAGSFNPGWAAGATSGVIGTGVF
jgi:hypothetical protein